MGIATVIALDADQAPARHDSISPGSRTGRVTEQDRIPAMAPGLGTGRHRASAAEGDLAGKDAGRIRARDAAGAVAERETLFIP